MYTVGIMAGRPPIKEAPPFGARLAAARKARNWSQTEFANRIGVSRALIDYYERRAENPTMSFVRRASDTLGIPAADLIGDSRGEQTRRSGPPSKIERQIEDLRRLPKSKQRFVSEFLDTVLQQARAG